MSELAAKESGPGSAVSIPESLIKKRIEEKVLNDAVERAVFLSLLLVVVFTVYGFASFGFIQKFNPTAKLWTNLWPRIFVSSLPSLGLALFLRSSTVSASRKLDIWCLGIASIIHASSWIYIWPTAIKYSSLILAFVNSANVFLYAAIFIGVGPPNKHIWRLCLSFSVIFVAPLIAIAAIGKDQAVVSLLLGDSIQALAISIILCKMINRLREKVARLEIEKEVEASKFLGPVLSQAIFEKKTEMLERVKCKGFIISIDVRDSTTLQKQLGQAWLDFRRDYFALVGQLVRKYQGYVQKTVGDCHVINFGVMDYGVDLSDIPGIETELQRAEERRLQRASKNSFGFLDDLMTSIEKLTSEKFPGTSIRLGAGIDKGEVERGVQGDAGHNLELDVNGDAVNCSSRLQEYSKIVAEQLQSESESILVVSPFASDYLADFSQFQRVQTLDRPIRNYTSIHWVLVKRYSAGKAVDQSGSTPVAA